MNVTVEVVGAESRDLTLADDATYGDVIREAGFSPQEASVLVDGSPVPEDGPVEAERVTLLRLIKGGSEGETSANDATTSETERPDGPDDSDSDDSDPTDPNDLDFSLPNPGHGPDPLSLEKLDADVAVLLFHRDFLCGNCRKQVEAVCDRYGEFVDLNAEVVSVLPEPRDKAAEWVDYHDAPYPIVADPDNAVASRYGQPVKFGPLGRRFDLLGRMPLAALVDLRREPELLWVHAGDTPVDRPDVDDLLAELRKFA